MDFKSFFIPDYSSLQTDLPLSYLNHLPPHSPVVEYPTLAFEFGRAPYFEHTLPFEPIIYDSDAPPIAPIGVEVPLFPEFIQPKVRVRHKSTTKGNKRPNTLKPLSIPTKVRNRMEILIRMSSFMNGGSREIPGKSQNTEEITAEPENNNGEPEQFDPLEIPTFTAALAKSLGEKLQFCKRQMELQAKTGNSAGTTGLDKSIKKEQRGSDEFN